MTNLVFSAVLLSAFLHAIWNTYAKTSGDKITHFTIMAIVQAVLGLAIFLYYPLPEINVLPLLIAGAACHATYRFLLGASYETGDLSFIYPICRGSAPLIVIVLTLLYLNEHPSETQLLGIIIISASILSLGFNKAHHTHTSYILALLTGLSIAGYSFFGGWAARTMNNALLAVSLIGIIDSFMYVSLALFFQKQRIKQNISAAWKIGTLSEVISFFGYTIAVWCMTQADMSAVTALRATSVVFATLIGTALLKEGLSLHRLGAAIFIIVGIALIKF